MRDHCCHGGSIFGWESVDILCCKWCNKERRCLQFHFQHVCRLFPGRNPLLKIIAMNGVGVISSLAVCLFLLLASFSAAREERSARTAPAKELAYLALVKCTDSTKAEVKCAASITSKTTVLSNCTCNATADTKVYAGVTSASRKQGDNKQERTVKLVDSCPENKIIKIYTMNEAWKLTTDVAAVKLAPKGEGVKLTEATKCKLVGFGSAENTTRVLEQNICACTTCAIADADVLCTKANATTLAGTLDLGGPAICNDMQYGVIHMKGKQEGDDKFCNAFIDISEHSDWILGVIEGSSTGNSTNGNGTTGVSSADSIYHQFKKHSKWRVGLMILLAAKLFLQ